ncbi:MAG: DUF4143 domain-containing protein, partial [Deltaproteobacteria bacterium]|nr:DUF4143 domain-containing protein [Deltaproteobacteria bacterium]
ASPLLLRQGAESLAGRLAVYELGGFDLDEVGRGAVSRRWLRGGFPRSFLAEAEAHSVEWRREFIETFLGRDLPQLGITVAPMTLRRFWTMLAHAHGQVANLSQLGRSLGVADTTVRRYLDILVSTFVVRQLLPWWENLKKRQVKAPKIYLSDSGLLHTLLGIETPDELEGHPKLGASFEGFALEMITRAHALRPEECFFWATHAGAEIDLLVVRGDRRIGFEFKRTAAPKVSRSMRVALSDLRLQRLMVVHAGTTSFPLAPKIDAIPLADVGDLDLGLR